MSYPSGWTHEQLRQRRAEIREKFNGDPRRWTIELLMRWYGVSRGHIYNSIRNKKP